MSNRSGSDRKPVSSCASLSIEDSAQTPAPAESPSHRCTSSPSRGSASGCPSRTTRTADCGWQVAPRGIVPPRLRRVCQNLAAADAPGNPNVVSMLGPQSGGEPVDGAAQPARSRSSPQQHQHNTPERCAIGGQPHAQPAARVDIIAGVIASLVHDLVDPYGVCARWRHAGTADVDVIDPGDNSGVIHIMILSPAPR